MATTTDIKGEQYLFGLEDEGKPSGITGFTCRAADIKYEPEVFENATNGQGETEAVALSANEYRKITGQFTGYIGTDFDAQATAEDGVISFENKDFVVKNVSVPREKGRFVEVTIDGEHYPKVQSAS